MEQNHEWNVGLKPLVFGFLTSIVMTLIAYFIAVEHVFSKCVLLCVIIGLACLQAVIQLVFFLHLGVEAKPRWNLVLFIFTVVIMIVIVLGSLWIMYNLNYNMKMPMGSS